MKQINFRLILPCVLFLSFSVAEVMAGSYGGPTGMNKMSADEIKQRNADLKLADEYITDGYRFLNGNELDKAEERFNAAKALIGDPSPANSVAHANIQNGLSSVYFLRGFQAAEAGNPDQSVEFLKKSLEFNPNNTDAAALLAQMERESQKLARKKQFEREMTNQALTPEFLKEQGDIATLFRNGDAYYQSGQFDKAIKSYESILAIDRDNVAASKRLEKVYEQKLKGAEALKGAIDVRAAWEVKDKWGQDFRRRSYEDVGGARTTDSFFAGSEIDRKLTDINIPTLKFTDASLQAAIKYIQDQARLLDTKSPEGQKGVNFVMQLPPDVQPNPITLDLQNVSLRDALRFIAEGAGVGFRVDPVAVVILPGATGEMESLQRRRFKVPAGFITTEVNTSTPTGGAGGRVSTGTTIATGGVRESLEAKGVTFPPGASASMISPTTLLVVNTPANLELIDELVRIGDEEDYQIQIEARFVELNQNDLNELGFDWILGNVGVGNGKVTVGGAATVDGVANVLTGGLRNANGSPQDGRNAINASSIDALIGQASTIAPDPVLAITGILTRPQFQMVIRALAEKKNVDLLSAPSVTTRVGQQARIGITREFIYPTEYERPQVPTGTGDAATAAVVTPANPSGFVTRETGVILTVTPSVGSNKRTIDLTLVPEVTEFDGFINYGSPIRAATGEVLTDNVINQPIFSVRKVDTRVFVFDGETVALGGLIREDIQKVHDKVPILGDIPGIGRLFQNKVEQSLKKNLTIFVTATLVDPAGDPLNK
ncbi:tetratricopeptide repeat protein [Oscillatoria amoena NRMC-F 0135]|nr:tetratricopeptide repeat protein [Oscillatoria amoena NRMC-F 0135]